MSHPSVRIGSVIDDRTLRGPIQQFHAAINDIIEYDRLAGHLTNPNKSAISAVALGDRKILAKLKFDGSYIRVFLQEKVLGEVITVVNRGNHKLPNLRADFAAHAAKRNFFLLLCEN